MVIYLTPYRLNYSDLRGAIPLSPKQIITWGKTEISVMAVVIIGIL